MARLRIDGVTKEFSDPDGSTITAVDDVDLTIEDGEFLVLVGPSGCGKSTTLRSIAGLESVTAGSIWLGDRDITGTKPKDRDIAMVFQSYALYPHMTVRGNMRFGLEESTDLADDEIDERVEEAARTLDIEELLARKPRELSGGQQQRVALGRAIVRDPEVFLMDEPLSNLDAKLRAQMRIELQRLQEELGVTTIYVTHDQTEAMTMGDRIAILDGGRLQQVGTPLECYHQPNNRFVAGFLGEPSMNFFETTREGDRLVGPGFDIDLSDDLLAAVGDVTDVTLGIRPEDVELVDEDADHLAPGTVDVVEPLGDQNVVHVRFRDDDATFAATVDGFRTPEPGRRVGVGFPERAIHLFETKSGRALRNPDVEATETLDPDDAIR